MQPSPRMRLEWQLRPGLLQLQYAAWRLRGGAGLVPHVRKRALIKECAREHHLRVLVETGTYKGDMVAAMRSTFEEIHSIELDPNLHAAAAVRFAGARGIFLYLGDSATVLPQVLERLRSPALFWLDGHYSGGVTATSELDTPVRSEVAAILQQSAFRHTLLIDDARLFTGEGDYPSMSELESLVRRLRPRATISSRSDVIVVSEP